MDINIDNLYKCIEKSANYIKKVENSNILFFQLDNIKKYIDNSTKDFQDKLFFTIKEYKLNNFENGIHSMLIFQILLYNYHLKILYEDSIPFRDDKHKDKLRTIINKKNNEFISYPASVREYIVMFRYIIETILHSFSFEHISTETRDKIRDRNILIDECTEIILIDNFLKDKRYKKDTRISNKSKEFINQENEIIEKKLEEFQKGNYNFVAYKKIGQ